MKNRKIIAVLCCSIFVFSLAACSNSNPTQLNTIHTISPDTEVIDNTDNLVSEKDETSVNNLPQEEEKVNTEIETLLENNLEENKDSSSESTVPEEEQTVEDENKSEESEVLTEFESGLEDAKTIIPSEEVEEEIPVADKPVKKTLSSIINSSRDSYLNEAFPTNDLNTIDPIILEFMGLNGIGLEDCAISMSIMNMEAYGIVIAKGSDNQEIINGLSGWIENQKAAFDMYLPDQYEIAKNAILKEHNGYVIMIMCKDAEIIEKLIIEKL